MIEKITDPRSSIWINSSAGCGKTTLLVKRALSLLVHKEKNILCITFTKVAAAEMHNRIFGILGQLSVMGDEEIDAYLSSTLHRRVKDFDYIRKLIYTADSFIQIQTLHAFCWQSIKMCDPEYVSKEIYEEKQHIFCKLLAQFIWEKCQPPSRTAEITSEQRLYEILSSLLSNFHLDYKEIIKKLKDNPLDQLPVNSLDILAAFAEFLEINKNVPRNYISYNGVIETAINKEIWNIYEIAAKVDHILLDEAQDNNLKQWYILSRLCRDFLIDETINRSLFVVGDYKQSIYGFQGANPDIFLAFYDILKQRDPKNKLIALTIEKSYRSSIPILQFVDSVFSDAALCATYKNKVQHTANRVEAPGYIEVRPLIGKSETEDAELLLAISIKDTIKSWLDEKRIIKAKKRPIKGSDIAILVAHRTAFLDHLYTQLSSINISVNFTGKFAVKNNPLFELLVNLGKFLTYKYDEEALIEILKSPVFNWREEDILKVKTADKKLSLFSHIENSTTGKTLKKWLELYGTTFEIYSNLLNNQLITHLSNHYGSETPYHIDTFLDNALEYDSIYDFIYLFATEDATLKIKSANENGVRISTVHGSKGTQYPIVFVADSNYVPQNRDIFLRTEDDLPLLSSEKNLEILEKIKDEKKLALRYEHMRLLYVALTRAEDELYIVGTGDKIKKNSWQDLCTAGITKLGFIKEDGSYYYTNDGSYFDTSLTGADISLATTSTIEIMPATLTAQRHLEEGDLAYISNFCPVEDIPKSTKATKKTFEIIRGELIHQILEYIFTVEAQEEWLVQFLEERALELEKEQKEEIITTVLNFVKNYPNPAGKSEVEIYAEGKLLRMDNIEFRDDRIIIRDYKTGKDKHITPAIKKQMDLYKRVMQAIYPEKPVTTEIVWV